jgi:hypothetical protein
MSIQEKLLKKSKALNYSLLWLAALLFLLNDRIVGKLD